jgi:hypothetical protein
LIQEDLMLLVGSRWSVAFGAYTLGATLKSDDLETAVNAAFAAKTIPSHPDAEMKISAPCGFYDPGTGPTFYPFLDGRGATWIGFGIRQVANTPNPAIVEALFRERATSQFGETWHLQKKKRLNGLRKAVKNEVADKTPFRLTEFGALFICLGSGECIACGAAGILVAKDLVGRIDALTRVAFTATQVSVGGDLLNVLRRQEDSITPWPTGTASLRRKRNKENESASVRMLNWSEKSQEAHDLLAVGFKPVKIEMQFGESAGKKSCEKVSVGLTGRVESVGWTDKIHDADPSPKIEARLSRLLDMDNQVRGLLLPVGTSPLPMGS